MDAKLIARIQKLLALANHPGTGEAEASLAASKAQELLAEHNLTMSQVEGGSEEGRKAETVTRSALYEYHRDLMRTLADVNFCTYWTAWDHRQVGSGKNTRTQRFAKHCLVGRESNVTTVLLMFDYINQAVERLCPWKSPRNLSKSAISWKEGCTYRIRQRLYECKRELDQASEAARQSPEAPPGTALVLSEVRVTEADLNNDFRMGWEAGTTATRRATNAARLAAEEAAEAERVAALTPKERAAYAKEQAELNARQQKAQERFSERWERENERRWAARDMDAFWSGHKTGDDVGLDRQVEAAQTKKLEG